MADPFSFDGADPNAAGFLGQPVSFWRDLAAFGGNLAGAANARTASGHLANGSGFAGPLGAATVQTLEMGQKNALARSLLQHQMAQTQGLNINNEIGRLGLPFQRALAGARMDALGGMGGGQPGMPGGQMPPPTNLAPGFQGALGAAEGGANPAAVNSAGYSGQYQFGAPRLADLGIYQPAAGEDPKTNKWTGTFNIPGFPDVKTHADFLGNQQAQNAAYQVHMGNIDQAIAQTPGAEGMDPNGLRAVAHLGGVNGMQKFIQTGGQYNPADSNGTHLSDYYQRFSRMGGASPASGPRPSSPAPQASAAPGQAAPYQVAQAGALTTPPPQQAQASAQIAGADGGPTLNVAPRLGDTAHGRYPAAMMATPEGRAAAARAAASDRASAASAAATYGPLRQGSVGVVGQGAVPPQQAQASPRAQPQQQQAPDIRQQAAALQAEATHYEQLANRAALLGNGIGGDPTVLRQTAMEKRKLADQLLTAGPMEREKALAESGVKPIIDRYGNMYTINRDGSYNYLGRGSEVKPTIDPATGREHLSDVGGIGIGAQPPVTGGEAPGTTLGPISKLSQAETERLKARGEVEGHDLTHDRKMIEEDLSHVVDTTIQAKANLLKLRDLTDPAQTGFGANTLLGAKNFLQTWAPRLAEAIDVNANPGQEFKKISTMGAGKAEREDQGARGGLRLMQIYMEANPNLENQPGANKHMANMLLLAHQLHEDYATGANDYYQRNREGFLEGKGVYKPISQYDQSFITKMRPELYKAATDALNGKPYAEWSKGITGPQLQIVGGILQRGDPNAQVDLGGRMVPVTAFTKTIGPTDLINGR